MNSVDQDIVHGLEGVMVCGTRLSHYDGPNGTFVLRGGADIRDVAGRMSFEDVIEHLWPDPDASFSKGSPGVAHRLHECSQLTPAAVDLLARTPVDGDAIDVLKAALAVDALEKSSSRDLSVNGAFELTAGLATAAARLARRRAGQPPVEPRPGLGFAANFLYMSTGAPPDDRQVRCLETYLVVMAEHGLNPSTFSACVTASTGSDLCSAVVAAMGTLKGPAHGGAVGEAWAMVNDAMSGSAEQVVRGRLAANRLLPGFGHREYRVYDPRAKIFRDLCRTENPAYFRTAQEIEAVALPQLAERGVGRTISVNVDFYAGGVLAAAGIAPELFTSCFAMARIVGWCAHALEYVDSGGRLISPTSKWLG
ncbi:citrate synthase/methylcitrate synthase [Longispora fulva]|uniref:citrate synthase (unknown stereospecificity) n=1 Tax=Longispora fulva TaxID=619741 RepID=A0A8J7GMC4_9ACTN|nr:citrate/2-methylcitrate synthase [Longispora fulva]MBG6134233.1 citrate synthase [Longispora fulva]GIG63125.1 citrate synthase/methylcitrate synthase [Longispora fulva]